MDYDDLQFFSLVTAALLCVAYYVSIVVIIILQLFSVFAPSPTLLLAKPKQNLHTMDFLISIYFPLKQFHLVEQS